MIVCELCSLAYCPPRYYPDIKTAGDSEEEDKPDGVVFEYAVVVCSAISRANRQRQDTAVYDYEHQWRDKYNRTNQGD